MLIPVYYLALLVQGGYIISRGISLGRLPLVGLHDTLIFLAFSTALFALPFYYAIKRRRSFLLLCSLLSLIITTAGVYSRRVDTPLPPILKTVWFELHVVLSFFSYGLFGIGAVLGILYILHVYKDRDIESFQYIAILLGYLLFSLSMVFGGIWAFFAWGTYWLWTPKELWTVMLWLVLTLYLHLRYRQWWKKGRGIVIIGILTYFVVLFTYIGVGLLMKSSHSF